MFQSTGKAIEPDIPSAYCHNCLTKFLRQSDTNLVSNQFPNLFRNQIDAQLILAPQSYGLVETTETDSYPNYRSFSVKVPLFDNDIPMVAAAATTMLLLLPNDKKAVEVIRDRKSVV